MTSTSRRKLALLLVGVGAALAVLAAPAPGTAQSEFRLVVHPDNPVESMRATEVSRLFLKKVTTWPDGRRVEPVDQGADSNVRAAFSQGVHGREVAAIKAYWNKVIFSGRGIPPSELAGDREVLDHVAGHPQSIGYVSSRADLSRVKVVRIVP